MWAKVKIPGGTDTLALIDTGARISTCHPDVLPRHAHVMGDITPLMTASREVVEPLGGTELAFTIGTYETQHMLRIVPEFASHMILGRDFLGDHCKGIHIRSDTVDLEMKDGTVIECTKQSGEGAFVNIAAHASPIHTAEDITLRPLAENTVTLESCTSASEIILTPTSDSHQYLEVTLAHQGSEEAPLRLIVRNVTLEPRLLRAGTRIAYKAAPDEPQREVAHITQLERDITGGRKRVYPRRDTERVPQPPRAAHKTATHSANERTRHAHTDLRPERKIPATITDRTATGYATGETETLTATGYASGKTETLAATGYATGETETLTATGELSTY